jgi:glycosyltransferase involved in cell wall biosynthesis
VPPPLTVAMPVYNEQGSILLSTAEVQRHVLDAVPGSELVVVDDGSTDDSGRVLDEIAAADPRVRVIHQPNSGHGGALMRALSSAQGEYVMLVDSDRQIALDSFSTAWVHVQRGRDGVFGVRRRRHDPRLRLYLMRLVRFAIHLLFGVRIFDANVPYKLLRRSIWTDASACIPPGTLAPSLFLALFAKLRGYDIVEMDIEHRPRATGAASIRRLRLLTFSAKAFAQLLAFRRCVSDGR